MPIGPIETKAQKRKVVNTEMHKFGQGKLHSGSKTGPVVKNPKQAIAISLSESGQSKPKEGKPGGKDTPFHNVRHSPGGPANNDGYVPSSYSGPGAGHVKQPKGKSIGTGPESHTHEKPFGVGSGRSEMEKKGAVGNIPKNDEASALVGKAGATHANQPKGSSIGVPTLGQERRLGEGMGGAAFRFRDVHTSDAHTYGHGASQRSGSLRMSGVSGAHRLGSRKK